MSEVKQSKKKKKRKKSNLPFYLLFLLGFGILMYPKISDWYYTINSSQVIANFDKGAKALETEDVRRRMELAYAYNESLVNSNVVYKDPYREEKQKEGRAHYAKMLEIHEQIGYITIPKLDLSLPIYAGTTDDVLQRGVGHLEGTSLPVGGNNTHAVLTAHRGLPEARLFTDIDKLVIGDQFFVKNLKEVLAYQVDQIQVIEPTDFSPLYIVPGHDYVTLLTCTPYMINSHRLLVRGHRIEVEEKQVEQEIEQGRKDTMYRYLFYGALVLLAISLFFNIRGLVRRRKEKKKERLAAKEHGDE